MAQTTNSLHALAIFAHPSLDFDFVTSRSKNGPWAIYLPTVVPVIVTTLVTFTMIHKDLSVSLSAPLSLLEI